jgi:hypothetical protein
MATNIRQEPTSFSPAFDKIASYGDKETTPPDNNPYAKRVDYTRPAYTISPSFKDGIAAVGTNDPLSEGSKSEGKHKKSKKTPGYHPLLNISQVTPETFQLDLSLEGNDQIISVGKEDGSVITSLKVKKNPNPKFYISFVNMDSGLPIAYLKRRDAQNPAHLKNASIESAKRNEAKCTLYGKKPLYKGQSYKKNKKEILYPWASIKQRFPSKFLGVFSIPLSIEMEMKNTAKTMFKMYPKMEGLKIEEIKSRVGMKKKSADVKKNGENVRKVTIHPRVDPLLMIIFLTSTNQI